MNIVMDTKRTIKMCCSFPICTLCICRIFNEAHHLLRGHNSFWIMLLPFSQEWLEQYLFNVKANNVDRF